MSLFCWSERNTRFGKWAYVSSSLWAVSRMEYSKSMSQYRRLWHRWSYNITEQKLMSNHEYNDIFERGKSLSYQIFDEELSSQILLNRLNWIFHCSSSQMPPPPPLQNSLVNTHSMSRNLFTRSHLRNLRSGILFRFHINPWWNCNMPRYLASLVPFSARWQPSKHA